VIVDDGVIVDVEGEWGKNRQHKAPSAAGVVGVRRLLLGHRKHSIALQMTFKMRQYYFLHHHSTFKHQTRLERTDGPLTDCDSAHP
jgi:hypothetical protein